MSMHRWCLTLLLLLPLVPAPLAGQSAEERIQTALDQASEAGIPLELLQSKLREGEAKGIAMEQIAEAIQHRLDGLTRAQQALSGLPDVDAADLSVSADALAAGVSDEVLAEIAVTAPRERRAVAIAALTYLVNAEIPVEEAATRVQEALARGPEALQNLPAQAVGPGGVQTPAGELGPPTGIPAPGSAPASGLPDGAGPPVTPPGRPPAG